MEYIPDENIESLAAIIGYFIHDLKNKSLPIKSQQSISKWKEKQLLTRRIV